MFDIIKTFFSLRQISFLTHLLIIGTGFIQGQETIVQGQIKGFDNQKIKLGYYEDYITLDEKWIAEDEINNGEFKLSTTLTSDRELIIKVEDKTTNLFAEPGSVYNVAIRFDEEANEGRIHDKFLYLKFPFPKQENVNISIKKFNDAYRNFMSENIKLFARNAAAKKITEFVEKWEKYYPDKQPIVSNYIKYALANMEAIKGIPRNRLQEKYINNQPILYQQKEYMNFFFQLFQTDFEQLSYTKRGTQLLKALMIDENLDKSLELLMEFKSFENAEIAELYLIYGLFDVYHKKVINQKSSVKILTDIKNAGKNEHNKLIAENTIEHFSALIKSNQAPEFSLKNTDDKLIELSAFKGKYIYMNFWADWSLPSIRELKLIQNLHKKYGAKIEFISINIDDDETIYRKIRKENNYQWHFLHFGNQKDIKEQYRLTSIPSYFIIGKDGKYIQANAEGPLEVERKLYNLSRK